MVNVVPLPGSLLTVMSPFMIWQKCRLMARPRPVPPNFRVVEESACWKARNSLPICSLVMPMPVSETSKMIQPSSLRGIAASRFHCEVNLQALESRFSRHCRTLVASARMKPSCSGFSITNWFEFFLASGSATACTSSMV